jgi:hypothetical protein
MSGSKSTPKATPYYLGPMQTVTVRSKARLAAFNRHRSTLISQLRAVHEHKHKRGTPHKSFDADKSWEHLTNFARTYIRFEESDEMFTGPHSAKRFAKLATALGKIRLSLEDNGWKIFKAWLAEKHMPTASASPLGIAETKRLLDEFATMMRSLEILETILGRMASVPKGRPKGRSKLPDSGVIIGLAIVYERSTGWKAPAAKGLFADFARDCLKRLGNNGFAHSSLIDAIKSARHKARIDAATHKQPSPFA